MVVLHTAPILVE